jgi:hypothetical protein
VTSQHTTDTQQRTVEVSWRANDVVHRTTIGRKEGSRKGGRGVPYFPLRSGKAKGKAGADLLPDSRYGAEDPSPSTDVNVRARGRRLMRQGPTKVLEGGDSSGRVRRDRLL